MGFIFSLDLAKITCTVCVVFLHCLDAGVNNFRIHRSQEIHIILYFFNICNHNPDCGGHSISISCIGPPDPFAIYYSITAWLVIKLFLQSLSVRKIDQVCRDNSSPDLSDLMLSQSRL